MISACGACPAVSSHFNTEREESSYKGGTGIVRTQTNLAKKMEMGENSNPGPKGLGVSAYDRTLKKGCARNRKPSLDSDFIGKSPAFNSLAETIKTVAARKCSIIITGETGVGKEMVARQIHYASDRCQKVFVPVDCTTLTGQLFESQLFGHVKGAFTSAINATLGFFRAADGGTVFLDEISEIPLELQAKLLRVLQENSVTPLGSTKSYPIDVRVLCSTNCNLRDMVKEETFRSDLYYRLNVVNLEVPPLRQRKEDILPLTEYFLANQAAFYGEELKVLSATTKKLLLNYALARQYPRTCQRRRTRVRFDHRPRDSTFGNAF